MWRQKSSAERAFVLPGQCSRPDQEVDDEVQVHVSKSDGDPYRLVDVSVLAQS